MENIVEVGGGGGTDKGLGRSDPTWHSSTQNKSWGGHWIPPESFPMKVFEPSGDEHLLMEFLSCHLLWDSKVCIKKHWEVRRGDLGESIMMSGRASG